jgi:predicted small lipoprotein YifL
MNATTRILITAAVLATLAGCGNKGPLVLPTEPPIDPATVPDVAPTDATPTETPVEQPPVEQPPTDEDAAEPPVTPPAEVPANGDGNA